MSQTSTGKASLKSPGKGSSSNSNKQNKSGSASAQQQVLPESLGHDALVSCSQICVVYEICVTNCSCWQNSRAWQAMQSVSACNFGCLSVPQAAIRLCRLQVQEETATKELMPLERAQKVKVFWDQVPQDQHTHLLTLSLTCLRQRAANSSPTAGTYL
jgi:hypothetical protein